MHRFTRMLPIFYARVCFLTCVLHSSYGLAGEGPLCLACNKVVQPRDCSRVTRCGFHEKCYVERQVTDNGLSWFAVGCKDTTKCNAAVDIMYQVNDAVIQSDYITTCMTCCNNGDLCNRKGCGSTDRPLSEGILCYNCPQQSGPDLCDDITLCGQDYTCFIDTLHMGSDTLFSTSCKSKQSCSTKLKECCSSELCNNKLVLNGTYQNVSALTTNLPAEISVETTTSSGDNIHCPYHWLYFEESKYCYLETESEMTLSDARTTCGKYGLHLPIIETMKEQDYLKSVLEPKQITIWLDGTDENSEGKWMWFTNKQPITYFNWSPGQPDHFFGGHSENCMEYGFSYNMQWNDAQCHNNSKRHKVMCETGIQRHIPHCPTGWKHRDNYMYCVMDFTDSWYEADKICSSMSAHLPVADTPESFQRIGDASGRRTNIWLDGSEENHLNDWRWQSTGKKFTFTSWSQGEPNHFGDNEHCVEVVERTNWHWNDAPCDAKGRVNKLVCERFEVTSEVIVG